MAHWKNPVDRAVRFSQIVLVLFAVLGLFVVSAPSRATDEEPPGTTTTTTLPELKMKVCIQHHSTDQDPHLILVAPEALPAHLRHGDLLGSGCDEHPILIPLCHNDKEISVGGKAVPAHVGHGDTVGPCPPMPDPTPPPLP